MSIRVFAIVADNDKRELLTHAFLGEDDVTVIAAETEVGYIAAPQSDLVVIDLAYPQAASTEFWVLLHTFFPTAQFMAMVEPLPGEAALQAALHAGVTSFVSWEEPATRLREAAIATCSGKPPLAPPVVGDALRALFTSPDNKADEGILQVGVLTMEPAARQAKVGEHVLSLSPLEFDVLLYLARNEGKVVSPAELVREVWKQDAGTGDVANQVNCRIRSLRRKLAAIPQSMCEITTVRRHGYRLVQVEKPSETGPEKN